MPFLDDKNNMHPKPSKAILIVNILGFLTFATILLITLLKPDFMKSAFMYTSYYIILGLTVTWLLVLVNLKQRNNFLLFPFLRSHWQGLLVSFLLASIVFVSVPKYFRVLSDETNLLSVAKSMTFYKHVSNVTEGRWYYEMFWPTVPGSTEKRPFLFPFFTSVMHNVLGYHIENVFILNYFVLWIALFLLYLLIRFYMSDLAAFAALILVVSQPIVSFSATSASFEVFNFLFLLISFISLRYFLNNPTSQSFLVLALTLIMLANVRYESFIYGAVIIFILLVTKNIKLRFFKESAWYALIPILFLPLIWQRIIMIGVPDPNFPSGSWVHAFSFASGIKNIGNLAKEAFDITGQSGYAGLINIAGILALISCVIAIILNIFHSKDKNQNIFLICISLSVLAVFTLTTIYSIDPHPMNGRLYIPALTLLSTLLIVVLSNLSSFMNWTKTTVLIVSLTAFVFYHPVAVEDKLANNLMIIREYRFVDNFLKRQTDKNFLVICGRPGQLIVNNYGAIYYWTANKNVDEILEQYKNHLFKTIYVVQSISYATLKPLADNVLNERYQLETIEELMISGSYFFRISRIKAPN